MYENFVSVLPVITKLVILIMLVLFSKVILPWMEELRIWGKVCKLVKAAEKLAESGQIPKAEKHDYVMKCLEKAGVKVTPFVRSLIEAAVEDLDLLAQGVISGILAEEEDEEDADEEDH